MVSKVKMLVLDIDGTILNKEFKASRNVVDCLKRLSARGIKVVLATGRMYSATESVVKLLGIDTPVICYQGALVVDSKDNRVLYERNLPEKAAKLVVRYLRQTGFHINLYQDDKLYVESDNEHIHRYVLERRIGYVVVDSFDEMGLSGVNKLLAIDGDVRRVAVLVEKLNNAFGGELLAVKSMPTFCEITAKDATKGRAIEYLADFWGIKKSEIMAIGDQDNDIEMLRAAGIGVAMGNATPKLKTVADFITKSVDEDGVVYAVQEYIR